jgi:hypothetical protein
MAKPDVQTSAESTNQPQEIEPLKIETINGIRARVKQILGRQVPILLVSAGAGIGAGGMAQDKYRDWSGYNPDEIALERDLAEIDKMKDEEKEQTREKERKEEKKGLLAKARQKLKEAKEWIADENVVVKKYKEMTREWEELKRTALEVGDKVSFWLPFLLTFLAIVIVANKAIQLKKTLTERADPVVERNMQAIEQKVNQLIDRVNTLSNQEFVSAEQQIEIMTEMQKLTREFEANKPAIEKEIVQLPEPKTDEAA